MKFFRRILGFAAACWALAVMPALCTGGILLHHCDCGHAGHEDECGHEVECGIDPCEDVLARPSDGSDVVMQLKSSDVAIPTFVFLAKSNFPPPIVWSSPPLSNLGVTLAHPVRTTILVI